jgi:predicted small metal-binding protein
MARKYVDCRDFPDSKCSVALSADSEEELINAVVEHAKQCHGHEDTPEFRQQMKQLAKEGAPPA